MPTTQQLKFGAYWDAIPPFYSTNGLPRINESNYNELQNGANLMPIEMPKDLVLKFLWQVRSVTIKTEYEFEAKNDNGWTSSIVGLTSDQQPVIESRGPFKLTGTAISEITSRELRLPQGYVQHITSEPYPIDRDEARSIAREGISGFSAFVASDFANFEADKAQLIPAIEAQADLIKNKLSQMKAMADGAKYYVLRTEIERQEAAFDLAVDDIKQDYQDQLDEIELEYNEDPPNEYRDTQYGQQVQRLRSQAVLKIKQEAQLQWFDWEGGFDRQVRFLDVGKYRTLSPQSMHNPPEMGGLFSGVYQTTAQMQSLSSTCMAVLYNSGFDFRQISFFFNQEFTYTRKVLILPGEPATVDVEGFLNVNADLGLFGAVSTDKDRAAAIKINAEGDSILLSGYYETDPAFPPTTVRFELISYNALFNVFTDTQKNPLPPFPVEPNPQIAPIVLSGEYFGSGSWSAAVQKMQPIADKIRELKEVGDAVENGSLEFRNKDDGLLFEAPLFVKTCVPIKNVRITYKIDKLYTDPPDPEPPAGETGSA